MMNKMPTRNASKLRLLIALPLAAVLLLAFRSAATKMETITDTEVEAPKQNGDKELPKDLVRLLKQNPDVKSVRGRVVDNRNAVVISLRSGGTEVYYLDDTSSITKLERKYNLTELPPPPPPAPAAPDAEELPPPPPVRLEQSQLKLPNGVIYYIDGKEDKSESYKKLDPKEIHSVSVYKGEHAQKMFGKSAANGVVSIISAKNKDSRQVKEFEQKFPALPAPPPPVPAKEELPPPPPPVNHEGPLVPASGVKLVEDEKTVTYVLWPNDVTKREFEVAQKAFPASGFDLKFKEYSDQSGGEAINITIASKKLNTGSSVAHNLKDLTAHNNVIVVKGFKETGKFILGTTIPPSK